MKLALATFTLLGTLAAFAGTASGTLTVNGKTIQIKHAYAMQIEDWTDKEKKAVMLLVTDNPVPEKLLVPDLDTFSMRDAGVSGIRFEFYAEGSNYSMNLMGSAVQGSVSISGTFDKEQFTTYSVEHVAGKLVNAKEVGDTKLAYEITVDEPVLIPKAVAPPSAADTEAAQKAASTKAYLAFYEAMKKGDLAKIRASVVPERAEQMNAPEFKDMLAFIQEMMPKEVQVVKATETDENAELIVYGKDEGEEREGAIAMRKLNGKWLMEKESWKTKK